MRNLLLAIPVLLTGIYLIVLAATSIAAPERAKSFLGGFAVSAFAHFLEMGIRLVVGVSLILYAPQMKFSVLLSSQDGSSP